MSPAPMPTTVAATPPPSLERDDTMRAGDLRNLILSALATLSFVAGTAVFFLLGARVLDVAAFGELSRSYALAAFLAMFVSYGQPQKLLQTMARATGRPMPAGVIGQQLALLGLFSLIGPALAAMLGFRVGLFVVLWAGAAPLAMANTMQTMFRANHLHGHDALMRASGRLLLTAGIVALVLTGAGTAMAFAVVFAVTAALELALTATLLARRFGIERQPAPRAAVLRDLRRDLAYLVDLIMQRAFGTLDILLIGVFSPVEAVATYTVAQKLAQTALSMLQPLMNTQVPRMAGAERIGPEAFRRAFRTTMRLSALGGIGGAVAILPFTLPGVLRLFGDGYSGAGPVVALFAVAIVLRFIAAGLGLSLLARGRQGTRLAGNIGSVAVFLALGPMLATRAEAVGMAFGVVIMSLVLFMFFAWNVWRRD